MRDEEILTDELLRAIIVDVAHDHVLEKHDMIDPENSTRLEARMAKEILGLRMILKNIPLNANEIIQKFVDMATIDPIDFVRRTQA